MHYVNKHGILSSMISIFISLDKSNSSLSLHSVRIHMNILLSYNNLPVEKGAVSMQQYLKRSVSLFQQFKAQMIMNPTLIRNACKRSLNHKYLPVACLESTSVK